MREKRRELPFSLIIVCAQFRGRGLDSLIKGLQHFPPSLSNFISYNESNTDTRAIVSVLLRQSCKIRTLDFFQFSTACRYPSESVSILNKSVLVLDVSSVKFEREFFLHVTEFRYSILVPELNTKYAVLPHLIFQSWFSHRVCIDAFEYT